MFLKVFVSLSVELHSSSKKDWKMAKKNATTMNDWKGAPHRFADVEYAQQK